MGLFNSFQSGLERIVGPFAKKVSESRYIKALTEGFMNTMPITLGVAVIAVLSNLPIDLWTGFLKDTGLYSVGQDVVALTLSLIAIYVVGAVGYCFTRNEGEQGVIGAILSMAAFIMLMPIQVYTTKEGLSVSMLATNNIGSDGLFVAIIIGLFIPTLYCWLMKKNLQLKLPDSVPPMVSQSLSPTFVAMILFTLMFAIKYGFTLTPHGNVFTMISTVIGDQIAQFGGSPISLIVIYMLMNLIWFFGIHPNTIFSCYLPVIMMVGLENTQAFMAGNPLPYLAFGVMGICVQIGGAGNTLGLCIATLFAKSEKYKAMRKLVTPANIFNINEPVIFGFPVMLNPLYVIPMVLTPVVSGLVAWGLLNILPVNFNPTIMMPWVTPGFITAFFAGGIPMMLIWFIALGIHFGMYLPFFLIDDKNALAKEQENILNNKEMPKETSI